MNVKMEQLLMGEHCNVSTSFRDREYKLSIREAWFDGTEGSLFISRGWEEVRSQSISGWALDDTSMQETPRRAGEISLCANFGFRSQVRKYIRPGVRVDEKRGYPVSTSA